MARRVPGSEGGAGGDADVELARRVALQADDLPGGSWHRAAAGEGDDDGATDDLDHCLGDFPEEAVTASTEADRFSRGDALAYSLVWVLEEPAAAERAFAVLGAADFVECFAGRLAAAIEPAGSGAELLGHVVAGGTGPTVADRSAAHRVRLTAGTAGGTFTVHLDLLVLQRGRVVTLVFLADSPDPVPTQDAAGVAARVAARIPDG